jgi:hypothetical protein
MTAKFGAGLYGRTLYSAGSPVEISGTMTVDVGFAATLTNALAVSGTMPIAVTIPGDRLNGDFLLSGELDFTVGFIPAALFAGPLWGKDALCQGAWGPDSLCADPGWATDPDIPTRAPWEPSELCDG